MFASTYISSFSTNCCHWGLSGEGLVLVPLGERFLLEILLQTALSFPSLTYICEKSPYWEI